MTDLVQWVAIGTSLGLLLLVVELVRRRLLVEEYALVWLLGALALVVVSLWRRSLHVVAAWLGVHYPPAVLLLLGTVVAFVAGLYFSVVVSRHRRQLARLVEDVAILGAELAELRSEVDGRAAADERAAAPPGAA